MAAPRKRGRRDSGRDQASMLGVNSRTWIQIITERPGEPTACPETSSSPLAEEEHQPGIARRAELPVNGQAMTSR